MDLNFLCVTGVYQYRSVLPFVAPFIRRNIFFVHPGGQPPSIFSSGGPLQIAWAEPLRVSDGAARDSARCVDVAAGRVCMRLVVLAEAASSMPLALFCAIAISREPKSFRAIFFLLRFSPVEPEVIRGEAKLMRGDCCCLFLAWTESLPWLPRTRAAGFLPLEIISCIKSTTGTPFPSRVESIAATCVVTGVTASSSSRGGLGIMILGLLGVSGCFCFCFCAFAAS
mmetsp:Transcript_53331/g.79671  ORF Transcript_53331/g.79671 Transcript_53331/m.79671 type:complete len:226 (-) Transcript_53331:1115-1792(-)